MNRLFLMLFLGGAASATPCPTAWAVPITVAPGLPAGDQYRLAFVTSTSTNAMSSNIAYYNAFVTNAADLDPALESLGTTWTAIASTSTVAARDNTNTSPSSVGLPIYNLAGQLVATSNADLWGGSIASAIAYDEHGVPPIPGYTEVWTGTGSTGAPDDPADPLGTSIPVWGDTKSAMSLWVDTGGYYEAPGNHTLYAISGPLTVVPGDVNHDGVVNGLDISLVASNWLRTGTNMPGDASGQAMVNGLDFSTIDSNWLKRAGDSTVSMMVSASGSAVIVPEPATIVMAAIGGLALLACRHRRA
jgi:PEP-CTERM motif